MKVEVIERDLFVIERLDMNKKSTCLRRDCRSHMVKKFGTDSSVNEVLKVNEDQRLWAESARIVRYLTS